MKKIQKAFTLLELLVVIGIIGILLSMITVSFTNAQKQSRDARRKQDAVAIQNAMEQYYSSNTTDPFSYPVCSTLTSCTDLQDYFSNSEFPEDPINTTPYTYGLTSTASTYTITITLEKTGVLTLTQLQ